MSLKQEAIKVNEESIEKHIEKIKNAANKIKNEVNVNSPIDKLSFEIYAAACLLKNNFEHLKKLNDN